MSVLEQRIQSRGIGSLWGDPALFSFLVELL
jgi:hypothetical protein